MKSPEERPVEESPDVPEWSSTNDLSELFGEHQQTLITVGIFAAVILAFLGVCLPLFLL